MRRAKLALMDIPWRKIKPGWYVLLFFVLYSIIITLSLGRAAARTRALQEALTTEQARQAKPPLEPSNASLPLRSDGLWFPIPGSSLPQNDAYLPGAFREYRQGESQGFVFYDQDAGIPIVYGTPVIASADAIVIRADQDYRSPTSEEWQALINDVSDGQVSEEELDQLRGRQLWLRTPEGRLLRYAHLSRISVSEGEQVYRGQVVAFVGNSGTDEGVAGTRQGARLHFEVWDQGQYFGALMDSATLRRQANMLFIGP